MTHDIKMRDDGILQLDTHTGVTETLLQDFISFLETATEEKPLAIFVRATGPTGKYSSAIRQTFARLMRDPRLGQVAVVGGGRRYTRVMVGFLLKATGRDNIRFFDSEEEAVVWLKAES